MRQHLANPASNNLSAGFKEDKIISAIAESGYPLQGRIARKLQSEFYVTEEWGYFDQVTNLHRSLDILANQQHKTIFSERVHPLCTLLVECKRSESPYIFFRRIADYKIPQFPHVLGVHERIALHQRLESNQRRITKVDIGDTLGLEELAFINPGPSRSTGFSKIIRKGKGFELSGEGPFKNIILPLARALDHTRELYRPTGDPTSIYPKLSLCICVLEAPMILVEEPEKLNDPCLVPWIRVVRQEAQPRVKSHGVSFRFYVVDFIHVEYFDTMIKDHVLPFFDGFAGRIVQKGSVLSLGSATVRDLANWQWQEVT